LPLSPIGRFWYGAPGAFLRIGIGLACGTISAAIFWAVAVRGRALDPVNGPPSPAA
jgi:hypothetical protein